MKKTNLIISLLFTGLLCSCQSEHQNVSEEVLTNSLLKTQLKGDQAFAFEAISCLTTVDVSSTLKRSIKKSINTNKQESDVISTIKEYLPVIESALNNNTILNINYDSASDKTEYEKKMVISYTQLDLTVSSVDFYYNEVAIIDEDDDDDIFDSEEMEYSINGLIVLDELNQYVVSGSKEIEEGEQEYELTFYINDTDYIKMEQEIEQGEQEFKYSLYENNQRVYSYKLEIEQEKDNIVIELKESKLDNKVSAKFYFVKIDGQEYFKVKIKNNNDTQQVYFKKVVDELSKDVTYEVSLI